MPENFLDYEFNANCKDLSTHKYEISEAISGGGAWDDPDETVNPYDKVANLHLIEEMIKSKSDVIDDQISLDFGESISLETLVTFQSFCAPPNYIPKKINVASPISSLINTFECDISKFSEKGIDVKGRLIDVDEKTASSALKGFMPFGEDLEKQQRYVNYLRFCLKGRDKLSDSTFNICIDDKEREEFIMSAQIFKPSSALIASRFQSSSTPLVNNLSLKPGLSRPEIKIAKTIIPEDLAPKTDTQTSKDLRISAGRSEYIWIPNTLLCKRFNIEPPKSGPSESLELRKPKPILDSGEVEKIFDSILKDSRIKPIND